MFREHLIEWRMAPRFPQRREQIPANWLMMFSRFLRPSHPIPWHLHPHKDITRYRETKEETPCTHPLDCVNNNIINNFLIICQCRVVRFIWIRQRFTHSHKTKSSSSSSAASIWNYIIMRAIPQPHLISPCGQSVSHSPTAWWWGRESSGDWISVLADSFYIIIM